MAFEADEDLPPSITRGDLLLVDRRAEKILPRRDGVYVLSVARGLAVRQIHARLDQQFQVSGPGVPEQIYSRPPRQTTSPTMRRPRSDAVT
jgi:hypothetical protein